MLRSIKKEMSVLFFSPAFLVCVLGVAVCMLMEPYDLSISMGTERHTVLDMILLQGKSWILENAGMSCEEVFMGQPGRQMMDFVTVLTSLPFLVQFCAERKNGVIRNCIFREGKIRYYVSRMFCGMVCGGLVMGVGTLLYYGILHMYFPTVMSLGQEKAELFSSLYGNGKIEYLILGQIAGFVLYGMVAALFGCVLAAFTKDIYICLTIPFLIKWLLVIFSSYLYSYLYIDHTPSEDRLWKTLEWWRNNGNLESMIRLSLEGKWMLAMGVLGAFFFVGLAIFAKRMNGRKDYGV